MAMWKKVLLWFLMAVVGLLVGIYIFLSTNGRRLFNEQASSLTNRKVTVRVIAPKLPAGVVLKGLSVEGLLSVQRVQVMVDPLALLRGQVKITSAELGTPVLFIERGADAKLSLPLPDSGAVPSAVASPAGTAAAPAKGGANPGAVIIHSLSVLDGEIHIKDRKSGREWVVSDIKGDLRDIPLTGNPVKTEFLVTASLAKLNVPVVGQALKTNGWVNWAAKDMDASVQVVDGEGRVGLDAKFESKADDMRVKGHVRMSAKQAMKSSSRKAGAVEKVVFGVLGAVAQDLDADFSFRTAMDRFEIGEIAFNGKMSTGLNSGKTLGSIVDEMGSVGEALLKKEKPAGM